MLQALHTDSQAAPVLPGIHSLIVEEDTVESSSEESLCESKEQLVDDPAKPPSQKAVKPKEIMLRANSLKKAVRQVIEEAGKGTREQSWPLKKLAASPSCKHSGIFILVRLDTHTKFSGRTEDEAIRMKFELSPICCLSRIHIRC